MSFSPLKNVASAIQTNWSSAGSGVVVTDIYFCTTRDELGQWMNKPTTKHAIAVLCGDSTGNVISGRGWRIDDVAEVNVVCKVAGDYSSSLDTREGMSEMVIDILHKNQNKVTGIPWISPARSFDKRMENSLFLRHILRFTLSTISEVS